MEPMDAGQQRELDFLRSQPTAWVNMRPFKRWIWVVGIAVAIAVVIGSFAALAGGPWLRIGLVAGLLTLLMVGISAVAPERALERSVRAMVPTQESMERGDKRNWPPG
jgi:hypothetical protein